MSNIPYRNSTYLLLDVEGKIQFCNSEDKLFCSNLIKNLDIVKSITEKKKGKEIVNNYFIEFEEVNIEGLSLYLVVIDKIDQYSVNNSFNTYLYYKDFFTGIYNRNLWEDLCKGINKWFNLKLYSLTLIDIDELKQINDLEGHIGGDKIIKIVSYCIQSSIRDNDLAIRYGGDEFIILLPNTEKNELCNIVRRIEEKLAKKSNNKVTISTGFSSGNSVENLLTTLRNADLDMYEKKKIKKQRQRLETISN